MWGLFQIQIKSFVPTKRHQSTFTLTNSRTRGRRCNSHVENAVIRSPDIGTCFLPSDSTFFSLGGNEKNEHACYVICPAWFYKVPARCKSPQLEQIALSCCFSLLVTLFGGNCRRNVIFWLKSSLKLGLFLPNSCVFDLIICCKKTLTERWLRLIAAPWTLFFPPPLHS